MQVKTGAVNEVDVGLFLNNLMCMFVSLEFKATKINREG